MHPATSLRPPGIEGAPLLKEPFDNPFLAKRTKERASGAALLHMTLRPKVQLFSPIHLPALQKAAMGAASNTWRKK